jgi:hypothetical protein
LSWTLDAATTYYRNTGDTAFARQILPWLEGKLAYDATLTGTDGLIVTGPQISTTNSRSNPATRPLQCYRIPAACGGPRARSRLRTGRYSSGGPGMVTGSR